MGRFSLYYWVQVLSPEWFSKDLYLEKTWNMILGLKHCGKRPIYRWIHNNVGRHNDNCMNTSLWSCMDKPARFNCCLVHYEILALYVRLLWGSVGLDFLLMYDNACPHRAQLVDEFLETEDIAYMDCLLGFPT